MTEEKLLRDLTIKRDHLIEKLEGDLRLLENKLVSLRWYLNPERCGEINELGELQILGNNIDNKCARIAVLQDVIKKIKEQLCPTSTTS